MPIASIDLILGSYLAGGKVFPSPEVIENPIAEACVSDFSVCSVTRAQACKLGDSSATL